MIPQNLSPVFRVWDKKNSCWAGEEATGGRSLESYALEEFREAGLVWCDMEGFALLADGTLALLDECGHYVFCSNEQFEVVFVEKKSAQMMPNEPLKEKSEEPPQK